ncbi:MAG: hypothetical protein E6L03_05560 [Thaumarchaeota archaeon]|nr:MAG: hypothetical protein E6L03_05560 [Nitrososphaerota archaeon]
MCEVNTKNLHKISSLVIILNLYELEIALLDKEETITINDMAPNFQEAIRSFIRSLPNVELKNDPMSEEAYFYGLRNFAHFHGPRHIDSRLSQRQQEEALRTHISLLSCVIETVEQAENTKLLIRQAYDTCVSLKTRFKSAK